jgi:hypothetical protein
MVGLSPLGYHCLARPRRIAGLSGFLTLSRSRDGPGPHGRGDLYARIRVEVARERRVREQGARIVSDRKSQCHSLRRWLGSASRPFAPIRRRNERHTTCHDLNARWECSRSDVIYGETRHVPGLPFSVLLLTLGVGLLAVFAGRLGMLLGRG